MNAVVRFCSVLIAMAALAPASAGIRDNVHNLSISGPGPVKAAVADRICEFCHISHSSGKGGPLWARGRPTATYIPYSSSTAVAQPGQPTGTSILCLSCHDGTIALGAVINRAAPHSMAGGASRMPPGRGLQGTDLRDDHPISFEYSASLAAEDGEIVAPELISNLLPLDRNGELQCTTCHEAHDSQYDKLLRMANIGSELCTTCHNETGWQTSSHSQSVATWNGRRPDPWPDSDYATVRDNGCENCHVPHSAGSAQRLLRSAAEEENCASCHNGNVAGSDVMAVVSQFSAHRVQDTTSVHDPAESAIVESRHVECADCHDPHATQMGRTAGDTPANVRGVSISGTEVSAAVRTYEICLRCHGDSPNQPLARVPRQNSLANIRLKIQIDNPSFHPVAGTGQNPDVPSLINPLTEQSTVSCTDCHNSNNAASAGGAGPEGPHGSAFEPILVRKYLTLDNTTESAANYALCYGCHSRDSILADETFAEHNTHIREENTPCSVCHDPHGVSSTQGNATNNSHLINFDISVVSPNQNGLLQFVDAGDRAGSCDLLCHGKDHDNYEY